MTQDDIPPLEELSTSELVEMCRRQGYGHINRFANRERIIALLTYGGKVPPELVSKSNQTRKELERFISSFWDRIQSQLPCKGENRGKCTIYGCSDGQHAECLMASEPYMI